MHICQENTHSVCGSCLPVAQPLNPNSLELSPRAIFDTFSGTTSSHHHFIDFQSNYKDFLFMLFVDKQSL